MGELMQKMRLPIGSLVVDIGLVIYVTFMAGQMVERLEAINGRVQRLEQQPITPQADSRLTRTESQIVALERDAVVGRAEVIKRLERIEDKVDAHMATNGTRSPP